MYRYSIVSALISLFLTSCNQSTMEAHYEYAGVVIKRVDRPGETSFYYVAPNPEKVYGKIWVRYSGINDGFSGYLRFFKNGKVELLSGDGYFQSDITDSNKFSYKRISYEKINLVDSVYVIMLSTRYEIERNNEIKSKIKASYKDL